MKLGWKEIFTLAGVGFSWTTAPLMAQTNNIHQAPTQQVQTVPVAAQFAQQYQPTYNQAVQQPLAQVQQGRPAIQYTPPADVQNQQPQYPQAAFTQQYQAVPQQAPVQYQPGRVVQQSFQAQPQVQQQVAPQTLGTTPWTGNSNYAAAPIQNQPQHTYHPQPAYQPQQVQPTQQVTYSAPTAQQIPAVQQQVQQPVQQNYSPINGQQIVQQYQPVQQPQTAFSQAAFQSMQAPNNLTQVSGSCCNTAPGCSTNACSPADSSGYIVDNGSACDTSGATYSYGDASSLGCSTNACCEPTYYAGAELIWLQPNFQENTGIVLDPPPNDNTIIPFDYDYEMTPRVWFGYESCEGYGGRFTYWQMDEELSSESLYVNPTELALIEVFSANGLLRRNAFAGPTETLSTAHSMKLQTADFEFTSHHKFCKHDILVGAGLRYAKMDQRLVGRAYTAGNVLDEMVEHEHGFEGFGPTLSVNWNRPLSSCGGLSVYSKARGSILFGDAYQDIYELKNAGANIGNDNYKGDESLAIGELGLGLQYTMLVGCNTEMFVRGGYEGQLWWDAGGPLRTQGDMALHGLSFGLGFNL